MTLHPAVLPAALAFIMFSLGLGLRPDDFKRVFRTPWAVGAGLVAQVVGLPALAVLIALACALSAEQTVSLMILAACPGGVTAGMVTRLARGDTALSITLTAVTSVVAFASVPIVVGIAWRWGMATPSSPVAVLVPLPVAPMVVGLFVVTLLPVVAGMLVRVWGMDLSVRRGLERLATLVFVGVVILTLISQWPLLEVGDARLVVATGLLNLATMTSGVLLGRIVGLDRPGRVALAAECGMQNSALGITLAISILGQPALASASVIYAGVMNVSAGALIAYRRFAGRH